MVHEFIEHTADIQFRVSGSRIEDVFSEAAGAMTESFCGDLVDGSKERIIDVVGSDFESLLYNFLEELLVLFDSEHFLLSSVEEISIDEIGFKLHARVLGDLAGEYDLHSHVKAITYNDMFVRKEADGKWVCQITLDV
ncbi:MAG: archease [Nanoarchaeota archaeon]|nr:archease [Nanoarchaeota archaeon]